MSCINPIGDWTKQCVIILYQKASKMLTLMLLALLVFGSATTELTSAAEAFSCPDGACRCGLDPRGRLKAVCDRGDMMDPIPVRQMDSLTEVLIITAPHQRPNYLTIGPIFQVASLFHSG